MTGLDSGFFVELLKGNTQAVGVWNGLLEGQDSVVSCVTLYELKRLGLKGVIDKAAVDAVLEAITNVCVISWLDSAGDFDAAASLSHGLGMHMADALILSAFIKIEAKAIYTTDPDMSLYKKKGVKVILLNGM